eukprot:403351087
MFPNIMPNETNYNYEESLITLQSDQMQDYEREFTHQSSFKMTIEIDKGKIRDISESNHLSKNDSKSSILNRQDSRTNIPKGNFKHIKLVSSPVKQTLKQANISLPLIEDNVYDSHYVKPQKIKKLKKLRKKSLENIEHHQQLNKNLIKSHKEFMDPKTINFIEKSPYYSYLRQNNPQPPFIKVNILPQNNKMSGNFQGNSVGLSNFGDISIVNQKSRAYLQLNQNLLQSTKQQQYEQNSRYSIDDSNNHYMNRSQENVILKIKGIDTGGKNDSILQRNLSKDTLTLLLNKHDGRHQALAEQIQSMQRKHSQKKLTALISSQSNLNQSFDFIQKQRLQPNVTRNLNVSQSRSIIESHYNLNSTMDSPRQNGKNYLQRFKDIMDQRKHQQQVNDASDESLSILDKLNSQIKNKILRLRESASLIESKVATMNTSSSYMDMGGRRAYQNIRLQSQKLIPTHNNNSENPNQIYAQVSQTFKRNKLIGGKGTFQRISQKNQNLLLNRDLHDELQGIKQPYQNQSNGTQSFKNGITGVQINQETSASFQSKGKDNSNSH